MPARLVASVVRQWVHLQGFQIRHLMSVVAGLEYSARTYPLVNGLDVDPIGKSIYFLEVAQPDESNSGLVKNGRKIIAAFFSNNSRDSASHLSYSS